MNFQEYKAAQGKVATSKTVLERVLDTTSLALNQLATQVQVNYTVHTTMHAKMVAKAEEKLFQELVAKGYI